MRYFCSFSYVRGNTPCFGNCILETTVDPYDDPLGFHNSLTRHVGNYTFCQEVVLLFYKKVKA